MAKKNKNPIPSSERDYYEPEEIARIRAASHVIGNSGVVRKIDVWRLAMLLEEAGLLKEKND